MKKVINKYQYLPSGQSYKDYTDDYARKTWSELIDQNINNIKWLYDTVNILKQENDVLRAQIKVLKNDNKEV